MPESGPSSADTRPGGPGKLKMDPNVAGALCYLFGCLSGILFFVIETDNKRVRFHALQSILVFAILSVLSFASIVLTIFTNLLIFRLANNAIWVVHFVLWLFLVIKTYQGQTIRIPGIADFARQQVGWPEQP
jgi:uncharacterized membrane protein